MQSPKTQPFSSRSSRSCSPRRRIPKQPAPDPIVVAALGDLPLIDDHLCGICRSPGCYGACLSLDYVPMHVVFGKPYILEPKFRCRACTGLVAQPTEPLNYPDPVCPIPHQVRAGHTWLTVDNHITKFFRRVIREFWLRECKAYAEEQQQQQQEEEEEPGSESSGERELKPQDLPLVQAHALKNKLVGLLRLSGPSLRAGFSVHLEFIKPPPKNKGN